MEKILVIGASGQIGTELVTALRKKHEPGWVIAADVMPVRGSVYDVQLNRESRQAPGVRAEQYRSVRDECLVGFLPAALIATIT